MRNLIDLIEHNATHMHVWVITDRSHAKIIYEDGIDPTVHSGEFGYGFYVHEHPGNSDDENEVILEYRVNEGFRILDSTNDHDMRLWHKAAGPHTDNPNLYRLMMKHGIDAIKHDETICFYNSEALYFQRVYKGVIDDPLEETDTNQLDEIALGGLQRCTAVTINALLKDFHLRPIILSDVPVDHPSVLRVLSAHGLSYTPSPTDVGRTLQQFVSIHPLYDWYLLTPGHAMALIRGELYDAENKGPDGRKLEAIFRITRR